MLTKEVSGYDLLPLPIKSQKEKKVMAALTSNFPSFLPTTRNYEIKKIIKFF